MTNARPARYGMTEETILRRIELLRQSDSPSARMCAQDAIMCLHKWHTDASFPASSPSQDSPLPINYLESASMWVDTGRAHAFGFQTPEGW